MLVMFLAAESLSISDLRDFLGRKGLEVELRFPHGS